MQPHGEAVDAAIAAPEYDVADGGIVGQHADHDLAIEQVGDVGRRLEAERRELVHLVRATDIGDHPMAGAGKVRSHRGAHVTKADKTDFALPGECGRGRTIVCDGSVSSIGRLLFKR